MPTFRYFIRGKNARPADEDYVVDVGRKPRLKLYDKHLKAFNFKKALSAALEVTTNSIPLKNSSVLSFIVLALLLCPITCSLCIMQIKPHSQKATLIYSVLQELARLDGLMIALSGRNEEELLPLLKYMRKSVHACPYKEGNVITNNIYCNFNFYSFLHKECYQSKIHSTVD